MHNPLSMRQASPLPLATHAALPRGGWMQRELPVDGATAHVQLWAEDRARGAAAMAEALAEMQRLARLADARRDGAEVALVNEQAGLSAVPVSDELFQLAARGHELARATQGAFDPVRGVAAALAGECGPRDPSTPGWRQLVLDAQLPSLQLLHRGLRLDLRRPARAWGVDRAMLLLQRRGVTRAYVELGLNRRTLGLRPDGDAWTLALRNPRDGRRLLAWLPVQDLAVAGSEASPESLRDAPPDAVAGVTVVARDGLVATAWAQALRQGAVADALARAAQQPELSVLLVDAAGRLHGSGGVGAESADEHERPDPPSGAARRAGGDRLLVRPS